MASCRAITALVLVAAVASVELHPDSAQTSSPYAVVIYGATPAGISAAIAARRALGGNASGRVLLVEPSPWIGGMASGGLGCTDKVGDRSYGGLAREFVNRTNAKYGDQRRQLPHCTTHTSFEPHVATEVFQEMLAEANVELLDRASLLRVGHVGRAISSVDLQLVDKNGSRRGLTVQGSTFIDAYDASCDYSATYEGDLLAMAGVEFTVGREGRYQYNESLAGRRALVPDACYGFRAAVDPFANVQPGARNNMPTTPTKQSGETGVLPMVWDGDLAGEGGADAKVMSYNYRLCLTNATEASGGKRVELTKPDGYQPAQFELLRRYLQSPNYSLPKSLSPSVLKIYTIAFNGDGVKADVNSATFPISTNLVGGSWGYPNGTATMRATIVAQHKLYTRSLLWFWKTDPVVPPHLRAEMAQWGYCGDEFVENEHFPTQLYVREGRRMVGEQVLTQHDATDHARAKNVGVASIGVADYAFDVHPVEIVPNTHDHAVTVDTALHTSPRAVVEGCTGGRPVAGGWQVPYAAITPKATDATNLLVPVALSASHVAFASIRLELTWMALGQSAGIAAALAASQGVEVQRIPLPVLHQKLLAAGQITEA